MKKPTHKTAFKIVSAVGFIASIVLCVYGWNSGILTSQDKMQNFIDEFGVFGAVIFILFQAVQVVIPILPGGIGCLAGVLMFGAVKGFLYNYIGICIGSIFAFLIAKYYGRPILSYFFSEKLIHKYDHWTEKNNRFSKCFAIAIFLPVAPDDFLCYLAGTTEMKLSKFIAIILLGKPFAIALYSLGLTVVWQRLAMFLTGG